MTEIYPDSPELAEYIKHGKDSVNGWLARFTLLLISYDVAYVEVNYSGGGDSGQIDDISFYGKVVSTQTQHTVPDYRTCHDGARRAPISAPLGALSKQFESFCYDLLDRRGWEVNNEGSQGHFIWDLEKDELHHHHETNVTSVEVQKHEGIEDLRDTIDPDSPRNR